MTGKQKGKRLLIGAESFADAKPALRIAEALLNHGVSDIGGRFVENLRNTETWPAHAQCVVTSGGALSDAPTEAQQKQQFERDAKAFREDLARIASASKIDWRFDREEGDPVRQLVLAARDWDMLVIGHRRLSRQTGCILSIQTEGSGADRNRSLTDELSRAFRARTMVIPGQQPEAALLTSINRVCARVVVVDAGAEPMQEASQVQRLLEAARCPVLILGSPERKQRENE